MSISKYPYFYDLVRERYSCRHYDASAPVDDSIVKAILEAAQLAPSACNRQPWTFVVVRDAATRQRILHASRPSFVDAPVVIVACGHHDQAWHRPADGKDHTDIDLAIAVEHICLAAASLDLGTCWVCSFDVEATRKALGLPAEVEPIALIPLGYAAAEADGSPAPVPAKTRKDLNDIIRWEKY